MKKSLLALATLAVAGAASAQSSVTLFGVVDATVAYGKGGIANRTQLTNSGYAASRLGFRGTEDLGGGMAASFWLEAGLANDDGQGQATNSNNQASGTGAAVAGRQGLAFNRRSTVSLSGGFGEIRLGRDYTPQFWSLTIFDPFGTLGTGTTVTLGSSIGGPVNVRASNSIGYFLPANLGGFYGQAQYYMGENPSNTATKKDGTGGAFRVGYANGPINVALAASTTDYAPGGIKSINLGGQYDLGVAQIMAHYSQDKVDAAVDADGKGWLVGALVAVGPGQIRASYSTYKTDNATGADPRQSKWALGYVHNLSKRTALYTTIARLTNKGQAAGASGMALNGALTGANGNSTGLDLGIRHTF